MPPPSLYPVKKLIAITPELAQAIEDYRFAKRLKSEAEAIRQLLERGLRPAPAARGKLTKKRDPAARRQAPARNSVACACPSNSRGFMRLCSLDPVFEFRARARERPRWLPAGSRRPENPPP